MSIHLIQSKMTFYHAVKTSAIKERIWDIWTDIENWPQWDTELEKSQIEGDFQLGAIGSFKPKDGPNLPFTITELIPGQTYTFSVQMPFCQLQVKRYFADAESDHEAESTIFIHQISFVGALSWLFAGIVGQRIKKVLPSVMEQLQAIAEQS